MLKTHRLPLSILMSSAIVMTSSCSLFTSNEKDVLKAEPDFRTTENRLSKEIEIPPNLLSVSLKDDFYRVVTGVETKNNSLEDDASELPSYKVDGLRVVSNLSTQWLEFDAITADDVWVKVQAFIASRGFRVESARKDIGIIKTEYLARKEVAPVSEQGELTRLLNSWRTEFAEGAMDRVTTHVVFDESSAAGTPGKAKVYFYHSMMFVGMDADGETSMGNAKIKPYRPGFESEMLYQAMIYFGASQAQAIQSIELAKHHIDTVDGPELTGIKLKASVDESWDYLKSILYRVDWNVTRFDNNEHQVAVEIPENSREESSIASSLKFWEADKKAHKNLPAKIVFTIKVSDTDKTHSVLTVKSLVENHPMDGPKREYLFSQLGLIK